MILSQCNPDSRSPPSVRTVTCYSYSDQDELNISLQNLHCISNNEEVLSTFLLTFKKH